MTTQEMIDNFLLKYDINGSGAVAGFEESEILSFLNEAQIKVVEDVFLKIGPNQIYNSDVAAIIGLINPDGEDIVYISDVGEFPENYMFPLTLKVKITRISQIHPAIDSFVEATKIDLSSVHKYLTSDLNELILIKPVYYIAGDNLYIITDKDTTVSLLKGSCILSYIKFPDEITLTADSELSEKWHQNIVDIAVRTAMAITGDSRLGASQPKQQ